MVSQRPSSVTRLGPFLLLTNFSLPSSTICLCVSRRGAHVDDGILKSLLVIDPCETLAVELLLQLSICLRALQVVERLLGCAELLLQGLNLGLWAHVDQNS